MKKKKRQIETTQGAGGLVSSAGKAESLTKRNAFNSQDAGITFTLSSGDKIHVGQL